LAVEKKCLGFSTTSCVSQLIWLRNTGSRESLAKHHKIVRLFCFFDTHTHRESKESKDTTGASPTMTTSKGENKNKAAKKPAPRPAMHRRHSFDTCSLPPHASPASSPQAETSPPKTPDKCPNQVSFPEMTASKSSGRSRRHTMSIFDGGYAKYDRASGTMRMLSPPPPPSRRRQSISVGDVSGLLIPLPTDESVCEKVEGKDTSNAKLQQQEVEDATQSSAILNTSRKLPATMPPRPPLEDDDHMEDVSSSGQEGASFGGNVPCGRRMSIGSILGPIVAGPPAALPPVSDAAGGDGDDEKPPSAEKDSTSLLSLDALHVSSKRSQNPHQGPSPRSSAVI